MLANSYTRLGLEIVVLLATNAFEIASLIGIIIRVAARVKIDTQARPIQNNSANRYNPLQSIDALGQSMHLHRHRAPHPTAARIQTSFRMIPINEPAVRFTKSFTTPIRLTVFFAMLLSCLVTELTLVEAQTETIKTSFPIDIASETTGLHHLEREISNDAIAFRTTGNDPSIAFQIPATPVNERNWILAMDVFCPEGIQELELFYRRPWSAKRRVELPPMIRSEGWTTYQCDLSQGEEFLRKDGPIWLRLDLGNSAGRRIQIRNVVLRLESDFEVQRREEKLQHIQELHQLDSQIAAYYQNAFPIEITRVDHKADQILVTGRTLGELPTANLSLITRGLTDISALPARVDSQAVVRALRIDADGTFEVGVPATTTASVRDTGMRWQVVSISSQLDSDGKRSTTPFSAVHHVDAYGAGQASDLPPTPRLHAAKGMTCLSELAPEHLRELGLKHGSVNIVLSGLVSLTPRPGYQPLEIRGKQRYINESSLRRLDRHVEMGRKAGLVMAGILLIPNSRGRKLLTDTPTLQHPGADPAGTYAMPNLVDKASAELYAATLDVLAERYSRGDLRIDHWIVHNEIDAGWQWTNMGEVPMHVYLDHYFRSLRMVDAAIRRVNPHARAFISLTHHWNHPHPPHWRWYASKKIIEALVRHGEIEGNFPWALAHHPYPESLWESDTWNDNVEFTMDTERFTLKNWKVLDEYLHTKRLRDPSGEIRAVVLSEQGFHASESNHESLRQQAAAIFYTFEKIRECSSVLAFDYHRPVDSRGEGGLHLGLRGLSSRENKHGVAKPAWEAYKSIGTASEDKLRAEYETLWSE